MLCSSTLLILIGACMKVSRMFARIEKPNKALSLIQALSNETFDLRLAFMGICDLLTDAKKQAKFVQLNNPAWKSCYSTLRRPQGRFRKWRQSYELDD